MIDIVIKSGQYDVPELVKSDLTCLLSPINLSAYKIKNYSLVILFDIDENTQKSVLDLDGKNKYILFQNMPKETNYDLGFATLLTKFRIKLQKYNGFDNIAYKNILFIVDFSQQSSCCNSSNLNDGVKEADRRSMFVPIEPKHELDSVIMSDEMRSEIEDALSIIRNREKIYVEWGFQEIDPQARAVLSFYGPGGTGKTKCAHAVASALGRKILCVNYANIESMWAGESPKNLISAFNVAQESQAVLFMDEADSFLGKRITNVSSGHDQSINSLRSQMLILLEEFEGVVIFGTNLVKNFDKAFETRILKSVKFDLPNEDSRVKLFKIMIPNKVPFEIPLSEEDYSLFAKLSDGFSGREIRNTVLEALSKGAKEQIVSFSAKMFIDAINRHSDSMLKLKEEQSEKESAIEEALINSIVTESEKIYNEALVHIAIYAMKSDGVIDDREMAIIKRAATVLNVEMPNVDKIPTISSVCEHFVTSEQKMAALDLVCKVIAVDNEIAEQELDFLKNIYHNLGCDMENFEKVEAYLEQILKTNNTMLGIL